MGPIDLILNLAGVLVWLSWRSIRFDPLTRTTPATLVGTLRPAEPRRLKGWQFLAGLLGLLLLRAVLYRQMGPEVDWTPKLNLFFVVLAFRSDLFLPALLFSVLSFVRVLIICYFWLLVGAVINRRSADPDPLLKMIRLHLGPVGRLPWPLQLALPLILTSALWVALHPLLLRLEITDRIGTNAHLVEQGLLIGAALYLTLQYILPVFLLLHLIATYVYLGSSPLWDFVSNTAKNLLAPLRSVPLRIARVDFAPLAGAVLIFMLLHWLPHLVVGKLAEHNLSPWPP